jgi:hypothetical protein
MLPLEKIIEVQRMLDAGDLSHRAIAKLAGVSRGTVDHLSAGRRGLVGRLESEETEAARPTTRCPTCGGRVFEPCVYCRTIAYLVELRKEQDRNNRTVAKPRRKRPRPESRPIERRAA